jgi:hypothetical protein
MIDLNNPEFVVEWSPVAAWKHALVIRLGEQFGLKTLVETGTCYGDLVEAVRGHFQDVYSFELSPVLYEKSRTRFAEVPSVHLYQGSSGDLLPEVLPQVAPGPLLFWLDAHYSCGETAGADQQGFGPLHQELETIFSLRPESLVLIDDTGPQYIDHPQFQRLKTSNWTHKFFNGVTIAHDGRYAIPERF